jgi:hypothetical protein
MNLEKGIDLMYKYGSKTEIENQNKNIYVITIKFKYESIKVSVNEPTIDGLIKLIQSDLHDSYSKKDDIPVTFEESKSNDRIKVFKVIDEPFGMYFLNVVIDQKPLLIF